MKSLFMLAVLSRAVRYGSPYLSDVSTTAVSLAQNEGRDKETGSMDPVPAPEV